MANGSQNIHNSIVRLLMARGRWIRAGRDNIVAYLSVQLECGPGQLDTIKQTLLAGGDPLYVEQRRGHIGRIGLRDWVGNDAILVEEVPEDLGAAWMRIVELEQLVSALQASRTDADVALQLGQAAEMRAADLERQLVETQGALQAAKQQLGETTASDQEEAQMLRRRVESLESVVRTRTAALQQTHGQKADLEDANRALRRQLAPLKRLEPILEHPMLAELALSLAGASGRAPSVMVLEMERLAGK